jgi:hypothetical protein
MVNTRSSQHSIVWSLLRTGLLLHVVCCIAGNVMRSFLVVAPLALARCLALQTSSSRNDFPALSALHMQCASPCVALGPSRAATLPPLGLVCWARALACS